MLVESVSGRTELESSSWGAVMALALTAFALVASEFMPVSLLTPIAADLYVTEGQAGQAIAVSGVLAVLTSLFITSVVGRLNRKSVLLTLTGLMMLSGAIVAFAPNYVVFMIGRALLGMVIGGFWSMSAATAMRLVPDRQVPQALAILNGGNALAMVLAAPLGSYLGGIIGWRGAFFCIVPVAAVVFLWKLFALPSMTTSATSRSRNPLKLLSRPSVTWGMAAVSVFFMGQFALFTYLRPFLEGTTRVDVGTLSLLLLMMGVMGFIGTILIGPFLKRGLYATLVIIPFVMAAAAAGLITLGGWLPAVAGLLAIWGLLGTSAPAGWWTWMARSLPDDAEAGGGLMVAVVQLAITLGAVLGGLAFDLSGYRATFAVSAVLLVVAAGLAMKAAAAARTSTLLD
ncbi:MFS transporter [Neorhizobium sp. DT-125]|uniref:MFS transporter n=1 Tax=Neorhizobium sp. DT-125 TaxID=3396163 RepID=UPI003F1DB14C